MLFRALHAGMQQTKQATLEFVLHWQDADARHSERLYFEKISFWRDFFPGSLGEQLADLPAGGVASQLFAPGELLPAYQPAAVHAVRAEQIHIKTRNGAAVNPRTGRFYPRGMFSGLPDVYAGDLRPLRYLGVVDGTARVDLNHPLAPYPLRVEGHVIQTLGQSGERGGRSHDIADELTRHGPGMQSMHPQAPTDCSSDEPFARLDERADILLYRQPQLTHHLDAMLRAQIAGLYTRFLTPGMRVLDLMSGWASHLPEHLDLHVTGIGLSAEELAHNPRLNERVAHDLNLDPQLPFADASFDAVLCTSAVEYLVRPVEVFCAVRRVLKPGAPFVLTFSERWVAPRVIQLWPLLHPFERLGLVLDYFRRSGFTGLGTETARDWPRPPDDPHACPEQSRRAGQFAFADPLFAACGRSE